MKYIDAERLKAEIEKTYKSEIQPWLSGVSATSAIYDYVLPLIDSLQQEQPSLPSNLDEAAEEYAYNNWEDNDYHTGAREGLPFDAIGHTEKCFKAGAEWMAEQGVSMEYEVEDKCLGLGYGSLPGLDPIIILPDYFKPSDKVIVQIRKKD